MSTNGYRPVLSNKGLLSPDNCIVALINSKPQMLFGVANMDRQSLIKSNLISARRRIFWPQIRSAFPNELTIERSTMNAWDDAGFVATIQKAGRKKIILAGLWTETCVALPTMQALHDGYDVYVVEDCCAGRERSGIAIARRFTRGGVRSRVVCC